MIENFLEYIGSVRRYSARTRDIYADVLEEYVLYSGGDEIPTPTSIRNYEVNLLDGKKESARTVGLHISVLSSYCRFLMKKGLLASNPARLVTRPKVAKRLPVFYREESMDSYFKETEHDADKESLQFLMSLPGEDKTRKDLYERRLRRLIISTLYCTGIRRAELISLNRSSVDFKRRTMRVRGKGDKVREIPLVQSLCNEISLYLDAVDTIFEAKHDEETPLMMTPSGSRLYPVYVDKAVKKELGEVPGISGRKSPHVLRHTLASELLDDGADLNSIKELLGHSSLAATQVYTHNTIERLKKVYETAHPRAKNGGKNGD